MEHEAQTPGDPTPRPAGPPADEPPRLAERPPGRLTDPEARTFGMLAHLSAFAGFVVPFGNLLGPLLVWLLKREEHPFVDDQGKEALNFQISMTIYYVVAAVLIIVLIGVLLLLAAVIFSIVVTIVGAVRANGGETYRYPLCIRFIK